MIKFFVPGKAGTQGSKYSFRSKTTGRMLTFDDNRKLQGWRDRVSIQCAITLQEQSYERFGDEDPVMMELEFLQRRPKVHYRTGKETSHLLSSTAPVYPLTRPDLVKLARAVEDALSGVLYKDDSQIVHAVYRKRYALAGEDTGVWVTAVSMALDTHDDVGCNDLHDPPGSTGPLHGGDRAS